MKIEKLFSENKNVFDMNSVCLQAVQKQMNAEKYASLVYKQMVSAVSTNGYVSQT